MTSWLLVDGYSFFNLNLNLSQKLAFFVLKSISCVRGSLLRSCVVDVKNLY